MRDDIDYEEQNRGRKSKDSLIAAIWKNALAPLVAIDSTKNAGVSKLASMISKGDTSKSGKKLSKSFKDYPDSVFENAVTNMDVFEENAPEFSTENPNTSAALATILDFVDLPAYAGLKGAGKVMGESAKYLPTVTNVARKGGDMMADAGAEAFVKKLTKKMNMDEVPKLVDYVKKNNLRGELSKPEKLLEKLQGKHELKNTGTLGHPVFEKKKISDGTLDVTGKEIVNTVKKADEAGAKPINRVDIFKKMRGNIRAKNASDTGWERQDFQQYDDSLQEGLKPFRELKYIDEKPMPSKPDTMPELPIDDMEKKIQELRLNIEATKAKKAQESSDLANSKKTSQSRKAEIDEKVGKSKAERAEAERIAQEEATRVTEEMLEHEAYLSDLKEKLKLKTRQPKPLNTKPIPKTRKDGQPLSAKRAIDLQKYNEKAKASQQAYQEWKSLPPAKTLEEELERLSARTFDEPRTADDIAPLPIEPHMLLDDSIQSVPVIPAGDDGLEKMLAELSDSQSAIGKAKGENKKIASENAKKMAEYQAKASAAGPNIKTKLIPRISQLQDMWQVKKDAREMLSKTDWNRTENLPWKKDQILEVTADIDNRIQESLKDIWFEEGNAADIYRSLNSDYGTQAEFLDLVADATIADWRSGGKSKGGALPALTGGVAAAFAAKMTGGSVPLASLAGAGAAEVGRKGFFSGVPEIAAKIGDKVSKDDLLGGHMAAHSVVEPAQMITNAAFENGEPSQREVPVEMNDDGTMDASQLDPEAQAELQKLMRRTPQGAVEVPGSEEVDDIMAPSPVEQKMDETLSPQKPQFDAYMNEELLNTILPRDTKRLLANPRALIAKLQQAAPDKVSMLQDMMENDPEGLEEAAPMLAQMFPAMFERDKYGMFDGKIVDPMMQQKFLADLYQDESMDSIKKAELSSKVKRGASIYS